MAHDPFGLESLTLVECQPFLPAVSVAKCLKVLSGETFLIGVFVGDVPSRFTVRLAGIATAEMRSKVKAEKALAKHARDTLHRLMHNRLVRIVITNLDKYGRLYARVSIGDVEDVSEYLVQQHLAVARDSISKVDADWDGMLRHHMRATIDDADHDGSAALH